MPQVSLYIDNDIRKKVKSAARNEHVSISEWVRRRIQKSLAEGLPRDFADLYGSIADKKFQRPRQPDTGHDIQRQSM